MYDGDLFFKKREEMDKYIDDLGFEYEFILGPENGQKVLIIYKKLRSEKNR
jgi:hypothetical protein